MVIEMKVLRGLSAEVACRVLFNQIRGDQPAFDMNGWERHAEQIRHLKTHEH